MENFSGQVLALPPGRLFFGRTCESALCLLMEDENEGTKIVHASIGIE